jgi:hypothetical protein
VGKSSWYPLGRRLGGPQSWSGCGGKEINSQPLLGLEPPGYGFINYKLYTSPDIIRVIKSRRMRWAAHVAHMDRYKMHINFGWKT